ncbi:AAEL013264-PA [Aedes aegypti]|uniref:AAEL013264-PA n=1 Tax=Aedes aegypti TaxID=7159 RepID=Q16JP1_AEDAE|nr:AAEL013264-PA [Aedes aegypti]
MSLWARVNQLPQPVLEQIRYIYGNSFPIEVRHYLAEWIEERLLPGIATTSRRRCGRCSCRATTTRSAIRTRPTRTGTCSRRTRPGTLPPAATIWRTTRSTIYRTNRWPTWSWKTLTCSRRRTPRAERETRRSSGIGVPRAHKHNHFTHDTKTHTWT